MAMIQKRRRKRRRNGPPVSHQSDGWQTQFSLPADMTGEAVSWARAIICTLLRPDGPEAVIVIVGDNADEALPVLANRLLEQQRSRDPQLQVDTNKSIEAQRPYVATTEDVSPRRPDVRFFHRAGQSG